MYNIKHIIFSDSKIKLFQVDLDRKTISFTSLNAYDCTSEKYANLVVQIKNWKNILMDRSVSSISFKNPEATNDIEEFALIQEHEFINDNLILSGFGKNSGHWMNMEIENPEISIESLREA